MKWKMPAVFAIVFIPGVASQHEKPLNSLGQPKFLIITADDYGASVNINQGIEIAAENDLLSAISAMTNFTQSLNGLKSISEKYPNIGIGVHLNITTGKPISKPELVNSLVNENGYFYTIGELLPRIKNVSIQELRIELKAQIQILSDQGFRIDHLSNQHGILSLYPPFFEVVIELAREYNLPVRSPVIASAKYPKLFPYSGLKKEGVKIFRAFALSYPLKALVYTTEFDLQDFNKTTSKLDNEYVEHPDLLIDCFYGDPTETNLNYILENLPPGINEIVLHLGTNERQQEYPSGLNLDYFIDRELELSTIINCHFNNQLQQLNIKKINFSEMHKITDSSKGNQIQFK